MKKLNIIVFLAMCIFLTGCFDKVELEERALVLAIGIDKYTEDTNEVLEKTGEIKRFVISMSMPEVSETEKNESDDPMEKESDTKISNEAIKIAEGASISSTIDLIDTYISQDLYFGHTKVAILGEELLKDESLLKETLDALERNKEISSKIIMLASKSTAVNILETVPKDEKMIGIYINDFYKNNKRNSAFTFRVDLEDIIKDTLSTEGDTAIPIVDILDGDIILGGLAIIHNYNLAGYLDDRQTKGILWIMDKNSLGEITVPFDETFVSLDIFDKDMNIDFYDNNGKITCNINIDIKGNISEYLYNLIDIEKYEILEEVYEEYLKGEIIYSLESMKDLGADVLEIKEDIRKNNYSLYEKYEFENIYDIIEFNVECNFTIKGSGSIK